MSQWKEKLWKLFKKELFSLPSTDTLFNPYLGVNESMDLPTADKIRQGNLRTYTQHFSKRPPLLMIGEAPGYNGCRLSGIPFTSEHQLCKGDFFISEKQSSRKERPQKEPAATIFWDVLGGKDQEFFIWNIVPLHPHPKGKFSKNRHPRTPEILQFSKSICKMRDILKPKKIIAIGNKAEEGLKMQGIVNFTKVRHPSHGGKREFRMGITNVMKIYSK